MIGAREMRDLPPLNSADDSDLISKARSLLRGIDVFRSTLSHLASSAEGLSENITSARAHPLFESLAGLGRRLEETGSSAASQAAEFDSLAGELAAFIRKSEIARRKER
jgi:hypothetical protein